MFPARNGRQKKARSIISYVTRGENDLIFFSFFSLQCVCGKKEKEMVAADDTGYVLKNSYLEISHSRNPASHMGNTKILFQKYYFTLF